MMKELEKKMMIRLNSFHDKSLVSIETDQSDRSKKSM